MLTRLAGGVDGFSVYMKTGYKKHRKLHRDQLDERIVLAGDLDLTEQVVQSMTNVGDRYLHCVLSFAEDHVPDDILKAVLRDFEGFMFAAYDKDEYLFYGEGHLPKIKSHIDRYTGQPVTRLPHIHGCSPLKNMKSGAGLYPFGFGKQQINYINDFQEWINHKYGLRSPKNYLRGPLFGVDQIIGRVTGSILETDSVRDFKRDLVAYVQNDECGSFEDFVRYVSKFGQTSIFNKGQLHAFVNVRRQDDIKGINLKRQYFRAWFFNKPPRVRRALLGRQEEVFYCEPDSSSSSEFAAEFFSNSSLPDWYSRRARELRYINSGNRKLYTAYREAPIETQLRMLDEAQERTRAAALDRRHAGTLADVGGEALHWPRTVMLGMSTRRLADNAISQRRRDVHVQLERQKLLATSWAWLADVDLSQVLAELSHSHGLSVDKFRAVRDPDRGWVVQCGSRRLDAVAFLVDEMHFDVVDALASLQRHHLTRHMLGEWRPRLAPDPVQWAAFRKSGKSGKFEESSQEYSVDDGAVDGDLLAAYRHHLAALGAKDEAALRELRRMAVEVFRTENDGQACLSIAPDVPGLGASRVVCVDGLDTSLDESGCVRYWRSGRECLVDTGWSVECLDASQETLIAGLNLAVERFAGVLDVEGNDVACERVGMLARQMGVQVVSSNTVLQAGLQETQQEVPAPNVEPASVCAPEPGVDPEQSGDPQVFGTLDPAALSDPDLDYAVADCLSQLGSLTVVDPLPGSVPAAVTELERRLASLYAEQLNRLVARADDDPDLDDFDGDDLTMYDELLSWWLTQLFTHSSGELIVEGLEQIPLVEARLAKIAQVVAQRQVPGETGG